MHSLWIAYQMASAPNDMSRPMRTFRFMCSSSYPHKLIAPLSCVRLSTHFIQNTCWVLLWAIIPFGSVGRGAGKHVRRWRHYNVTFIPYNRVQHLPEAASHTQNSSLTKSSWKENAIRRYTKINSLLNSVMVNFFSWVADVELKFCIFAHNCSNK